MSEQEQNESTNPASGASSPESAAPETPEAALAAVQAERDKLKDQLLRTAADFENFRKRARKDIEDAEQRAKIDVVREVLSVIDNLERAVTAAGSATDVAGVVDGIRLVLKSFEDAAQRIGLERVGALGEKFDPTLHDAVQQVETNDQPPGTVISEILPGYRLGSRLLRAALVVVAKQASN